MTKRKKKRRELPARTARPAKLLTRQQLATALRVSARTITRWENDGMPIARRAPRGRPSLFDLAAVRHWRRVTDAERAGSVVSLSTARAKLADAQREKLELDLAAKKGDVVPRDQVVREGQAFVKAWSAMVQSLPKRAAQVGVIEPDQVPGLQALCRDVLTEISRWRTVADAEQSAAKAAGNR